MTVPGDLSVQLYTVRSLLAADLDGTLATVADLGFGLVEPFDLLVYADGLRTSLPRHGLAAPTTHVDVLGEAADRAFDVAAELGIETVVQPWVEPARWQTVDDIRRLADELNRAAAGAARRGLRVGYHNHQFELAATFEGRHGLDVLADHLARDVVLEIDTYWTYAGGADVPALVERLGDRVIALHIKDGDGSLDPKRQVAAGSGVVPIPAILAAAPTALRVVELDDTDGDLLEAVRASRQFVLATDG